MEASVDFRKIKLDELKKALSITETDNDYNNAQNTKKIIFSCPVCGCDKYEGVFQSSPFNVIGGSISCKEIECENCHIRLGIKALCEE